VLRVHPAFNPTSYAGVTIDAASITISLDSAQRKDGAWLSLIDVEHLEPIQAMLDAVDPTLRVTGRQVSNDLVLTVTPGHEPHREFGEVALTRFSTGAGFAFTDRGRSLPVISR